MRREDTYSNKSWVSMESAYCTVCGKEYETGRLLLDTRMRRSFSRKTVTGMGVCPTDRKYLDEGFIALVEIDASKSKCGNPSSMKQEDAWRTGKLAYVKRDVACQILGAVITDKIPLVFVEEGVISRLEAMVQRDDEVEG